MRPSLHCATEGEFVSAGPVSGALSAADGGWGAAVSHHLGASGSSPRWFWWSVKEGPGIVAGIWEGLGGFFWSSAAAAAAFHPSPPVAPAVCL